MTFSLTPLFTPGFARQIKLLQAVVGSKRNKSWAKLEEGEHNETEVNGKMMEQCFWRSESEG